MEIDNLACQLCVKWQKDHNCDNCEIPKSWNRLEKETEEALIKTKEKELEHFISCERLKNENVIEFEIKE